MRFFDRRGIIVGLALVGAFLLGYAYLHVSGGAFSFFNRDINKVVACAEEDNAPVCSRPVIRKLLEKNSGTDVMAALSDKLSPLQCHYIGHVVGQQSYIKFDDVEGAIRQCNRQCDSACVHGVIGEAFAQKLGLGSADSPEVFDPQSLSEDDLRNVGTQLCEEPETCHGVGHTLFQMYVDFKPALEVCRTVAATSTLFYCYQGAFMEYADILYSRNMRPVPGVEYPTIESVDKICSMDTFEERRSCYRYYPRMVIATLRNAGFSTAQAEVLLREICREFPEQADRVACITGIGVYNSYAVLGDSERAVRVCQTYRSLLEQAACNLGQVSVATQDRRPQTIAYCSAMQHDQLRSSCFRGVFFFLNRLGTPREEFAGLCLGNKACLLETENFTTDPMVEIQERFAE